MVAKSSSISPSLDGLFETTLESYRQGCKRLIDLNSKKSGEYFETLLSFQLEFLIKRRFPLTEQLILNWSTNVRSQGLAAARRGQFVDSEQLFAKARTPLEKGKLSHEGSLLHKSFQEPAEAYLDFRRGYFDKARNRIFEALVSDAVLEDEFGYDLLFIHRLHLVKNLVRIEANSNCFNRAIDLASQLLSYLKGSLDILPILGIANRKRLMCQSSELVAAMFTQVTNEVALILTGKKGQLANELFGIISAQMQLTTDDNRHYDSQSEAWFIVKQAFVSNNIETFLKQASPFLAERRSDTPLLWYATVIDLICLCDDLDFSGSNLFKLEVAQEAANCQYLPKQFLPLLGIHPTSKIMPSLS
ncbi:hypothetical protein [Nostoc sp. FACHB-133]|uniref:hypothetical protein n=1 Tax=Nostoc sp. FACHB-133 TaxID=2692835 RepID=UPI001688225E|nr:hypothetical protein [Nostoc sp. FACHB-133]MBD2526763.1 hypothetical protein [Nostoc sp. FACHB-133]